ncbi:MAG: hypothetical protein MUF01_17485, partial [Bryobacterales bacterium]|nr:hypothetical protein [Bryobacterales bacterium]
MDFQKFQSEVQLLKKFADDLEELHGALMLIGLQNLGAYDQAFIEDMAKILNTAAGPLAGKEAEFREYYHNRFVKLRNVVFQGNIADVAIDYGNGVGKAIQCKSTLEDGCAAITNMIADAANQLTGERGETPRAGDRWVIDLTVRSPTNPWPFSHKNTYGTKSLNEYKTQARQTVLDAVKTYAHGAKGMSVGTLGRLTDTTGLTVNKLSVKNTRVTATNALGAAVAMQTLTVKIRYDFPYPLVGQPLGSTKLKLAAFEVMRNGNNLTVSDNR